MLAPEVRLPGLIGLQIDAFNVARVKITFVSEFGDCDVPKTGEAVERHSRIIYVQLRRHLGDRWRNDIGGVIEVTQRPSALRTLEKEGQSSLSGQAYAGKVPIRVTPLVLIALGAVNRGYPRHECSFLASGKGVREVQVNEQSQRQRG
jgi:hypothetical protein